jgi:hypothetical protein
MSFRRRLGQNTSLIYAYRFFYFFYYRFFIAKKFSKSYISDKVLISEVSKAISFFGYYNACPENSLGDIVFMTVDKEMVRGSQSYAAKIFLKYVDGSISCIGETFSYNWQQGSMISWLNDNMIIFNFYCLDTDSYGSKIIDKNGSIVKVIESPVYSVDSEQMLGLTLNFERLKVVRPDYGYFNLKHDRCFTMSDDGIWKIDLLSGRFFLLLTLDAIINFRVVGDIEGAFHWVNHIEISPEGNRFVFFHRWKLNSERITRLFVCNMDGSGLNVLPGDRIVSHFCWMNNSEILIFCNIESRLDFYIINVNDSSYRPFSKSFLKVDGHPSLSPSGKFILIDSYPSRDRFSNLYIFDIKNDKLVNLGQFYQPIRYTKEFRIDLHPKWGNTDNRIYFESGHTGKRRFFVANLDCLW